MWISGWRTWMRPVLVGLSLAMASHSVVVQSTADASARPAPPPLEAYGALPSLELVQLSPSGRRLAFIRVIGEQRRLVLVDLASQSQLGSVGAGNAKVRDLQWIGEDRVLITTSETESFRNLGIDETELAAGQIYDPATARITPVLANVRGVFPALLSGVTIVETADGHDLLVRAYAPDQAGRIDLYRVNPANGRARVAESMGREVDDFIFDPTSKKTVARSEYKSVTGEWDLYLRHGDDAFRRVWRTTALIDAPYLMGMGMNGDSVIVAADRPDLDRPDRESADFFDVNLETGAWRPVRFDFQPQSLLFHPRTGRLIGASRLENDRQIYAFADADASLLWAQAEATLADASPYFLNWSEDLKHAVLFTSGTGDAGTYYLLNLADNQLNQIGQAYEAISPEQVAPVRSITYAAADGLQIHGYLTTPPGVTDAAKLPLVVLAHGGPAARDTMGFDWWAQAIASRGYAVLQANFRGSTGYGEAFMEAGYGEWGRKMQTDLSDGVRWLASQGLIDPSRVCIVGASYGGYAALAGPTLDTGVYRCAVSVNGVSDLRRMVEVEARAGEHRNNETVRYWNRFMGAERLGDRSLDERSPSRLAAQADAPILLIHGRDDTVVPLEQSRLMAQALRRAAKPVEFIELQGEDHWLSRSDTRLRMLTETLRFLQAHNPAS